MGAIKNAFEDQINTGSVGGDEDYGYQEWTNELGELNERIKPKYSDMDIDNVLDILNDSFLKNMLKDEFNRVHNLKNGYFE
jgi:hypothetical protein